MTKITYNSHSRLEEIENTLKLEKPRQITLFFFIYVGR